MSDIVKVKVWICTSKAGSECYDILEFERDEWERLDDNEKDEICREAAFNDMEWGYREVE